MMSKSSLELLVELVNNGTLSKEAGEEVLAVRERLIRDRMVKLAAGNMGKRIMSAGSGAYDAIKSRLGHGGLSPSSAGTPGWPDVGTNITKMLGLATLTAAASSGIGGYMKKRKDKSMQKDLESSYTQMFDTEKRLNEGDHAPEDIRRHFGILARFAPSLAADPTVAGTFVLGQLEKGGVTDAGVIKTLAETQQRIDEMQERRSGISTHFDRGLNLAMNSMRPSAPQGKTGP